MTHSHHIVGDIHVDDDVKELTLTLESFHQWPEYTFHVTTKILLRHLFLIP